MGTTIVKWIDGKKFVGIDSTNQPFRSAFFCRRRHRVKPSDLPLIGGSLHCGGCGWDLSKKRMPS
jgi:hypothetical protein